jgi:hypothetical protein
MPSAWRVNGCNECAKAMFEFSGNMLLPSTMVVLLSGPILLK